MIGGFTRFLESVDQKAAEISQEGATSDAQPRDLPELPQMPPPPPGASHETPLPQDRCDVVANTPPPGAVNPSPNQRETHQRDHTIQRLEQDYRAVSDQLRHLTQELRARDVTVEDLRKELSTAKQCETDRQELHDQTEDSALELRVECERLHGALHDLQTLYDNTNHELTVIGAEKTQLEASHRALESDFAAHKSKSFHLLSETTRELDALKADLHNSGGETHDSSLVVASAAAQREVAEARTEAQELKRQLEESKAALLQASRDTAAASDLAAESTHASRVARSMYEGEVASHQATRTRLEAELSTKEDEMTRLKKHQTVKSPVSDSEWERRAKDLGELVMEKQAAFEAKRCEADQWRTRCEAAQQRVREVELVGVSTSNAVQPHRAILIEDDTGDVGRSAFFGGLARRGQWGRQAVSAAIKVDGIAMTAARQLKKSSVLRLAFVLYVIVLQVWCFFAVSLSSVPTNDKP